MTLPAPPSITLPIVFEQSKYSRKGLRIFRAQLHGGSAWAFMWDGNAYVCYSLHMAYDLIDRARDGREI